MTTNADQANEHTHLLTPDTDTDTASPHSHLQDRRISSLRAHEHDIEADSIISSHVSKEEQALAETAVGERLGYNDYTTIDWVHDLVSSYCRDERMMGRKHGLYIRRSRIPFAGETCIAGKGYEAGYGRRSIRVLGGLQRH
jgi:hypothetical protein